jgi:hypothetical protein
MCESRSWARPCLPLSDYENLRRTVLAASGRMSKDQLIDLADGLFDKVRERRGPISRATAPLSPFVRQAS